MNSRRKSLDVIHSRSAGVDIGAKEIFVAVPALKVGPSVGSFGTYTVDLMDIQRFLKEQGIATVAMESTGLYWILLYGLLSQAGL
jgi:transposase